MSDVPSAWGAFVKGKCPQCREGELFKTGPFNLMHFREMHKHCSVCNVKYEPEPGFFWGAMYFSYALVVGMCLTLGIIIFNIVDKPEIWTTSGIIVGAIIVTSPLLFRISRKLMVYITAPYRHYNPDAKQYAKDHKFD
jgi:uncharacterized protein (DUF983 family)